MPDAIETKSMAERYERPSWVRRINRMADALGGPDAARRLVSINADEMMAAAVASVGGAPQGDFGDPGWGDRFTALARAIDACSMHVVGRLMTKQELLRSLRSRLLLARALDERPEIERGTIEAPVIVTGPARSGTSIVFELIWLDPTLRAPLAWEALHPVPFGNAASAEARVAMSECEQEIWADVQPEFAAIHELRSDLPVECVTLTTASFCGPHWPMIAQMPGYAADMQRDYEFHRRILQALQHDAPRRNWLLKTPGHLMTLDLLFETYPDAWVVQTHRDPAKTMPSTVSTSAMIQWIRTDHIDLGIMREVISAGFSAALNSVARRRQDGSLPARFVDVHFTELMRDPVGTLKRAYDAMDREFTAEHAERIRRYLADKPKGKFGRHHYTPEEWGFNASTLRSELAPYIDYFGVAAE